MKAANPTAMREHHEAITRAPFIPAIVAYRAERIIVAYYGGWYRAMWKITAEKVGARWLSFYWTLVMRFCDLCGWTKCVDGIRHDAKCQDPKKCASELSDDCLYGSIPKWFQSVTRMNK